MKRIFLDTNILLLPLDVFAGVYQAMNEPYQLWVVEPTFRELERFAKTRPRARLALALMKQKNVQTLQGGSSADDELVKQSEVPDTVVATLDRVLQKRLKGKKLIVRQQKYFVLQ